MNQAILTPTVTAFTPWLFVKSAPGFGQTGNPQTFILHRSQHRWRRSNTAIKTLKKKHQNNMGNSWDCPWCRSSITERDTQSCVAHPVSFVNHLLTLSQQPTSRGQADGALSPPPPTRQCHLPAWAPSPMVPALDGGCGGRRGWCCHLPQHGALMLMDSHRSPG